MPNEWGDEEVTTPAAAIELRPGEALPTNDWGDPVAADVVVRSDPASDVAAITPQAYLMPSGRSTITGMTPNEAQARGEAGATALKQATASVAAPALRIGGPIGGVALAPLTGLSSIPAGIALGTAGAALAEPLAQRAEIAAGQRDQMSYDEGVLNVAVGGPTAILGAPLLGKVGSPIVQRLAQAGVRAAEGGIINAGQGALMRSAYGQEQSLTQTAKDFGTGAVLGAVLGTAADEFSRARQAAPDAINLEVLPNAPERPLPGRLPEPAIEIGGTTSSEVARLTGGPLALPDYPSAVVETVPASGSDNLPANQAPSTAALDLPAGPAAIERVPNEWGDVPVAVDAESLSKRAFDFTSEAFKNDGGVGFTPAEARFNSGRHLQAADAHAEAAKYWSDVGNENMALLHSNSERSHRARFEKAFTEGAPGEPPLTNNTGYQPSSAAMGVTSNVEAFRKLQQKFAPESLLPDEFRKATRYGEQAQRAIIIKGGAIQGDLRRAIIKEAKATPGVEAQVFDYMTGKLPLSSLPQSVQYTAGQARLFIDSLSDRAIREGVVQGELAQTFADNAGSYLRRSYRLFADPDYIPAPAARRNAVAYVQANWDPKRTLTAPEAETVVNQLLDRDQAPAFMIGGKIAGRDVSSLIKRKDLAPEIRSLYGEITDPIEAFGQTVPRMAKLLENHAAQQWIKLTGLRTGLFTTAADPLNYRQLVPDSSKPHEVWRGLYTTPDLADAMQRETRSGRAEGVMETVLNSIRTLTGVSKLTKTVLNPDSYAPNLIGGLVSNLANGNFNVLPLGRGLLMAGEELGALRAAGVLPQTRQALQADIAKLTKLGLRGESVSGADLMKTWEKSFLPVFTGRVKRLVEPWMKVYGVTDDTTKYMAWKSELARLQRYAPNLPLELAERRAADRVRETMPTYSEIPKFIRQLSQLGISPSFVSFTWEVFRNAKNTARIGATDLAEGIRTGNKAQSVDGARRLAALVTVLGASSGAGLALLSRRENKIDDKQDEAVRFFGTPWNREGTLFYNTPVQDGKVQFSNASYLLPHALLFEAVQAGLRGDNEEQAAKNFLNSFKQQFLSADGGVLLGPAMEAFVGNDSETGRPVLNRESPTPTLDAAKYVYDKSFHPLALAKLERIIKAERGEQSPYGRVYSTKEEAARLAGVRAQTLDFNTAVEFKARDLGRRFVDASNLYRTVRDRGLTPEAKEAAYQRSEKARQNVFGEVQKYLDLGRAVGVGEDKLVEGLRNANGLPVETILGALDGQYVPQAREKDETAAEVFTRIGQLPAQQAQQALVEALAKDPTLVRGLEREVKERAKGLTPTDKLIQSLSITDGTRAAYLKSKVQTLPEEARVRYLQDLARKGIVNGKVLEQFSVPVSAGR